MFHSFSAAAIFGESRRVTAFALGVPYGKDVLLADRKRAAGRVKCLRRLSPNAFAAEFF